MESYQKRLLSGVMRPKAYDDTEEWPTEPVDLIRDKFSQDCSIETVLHLVMAHFGLSEEEAQTEIDAYFEMENGDGAEQFLL